MGYISKYDTKFVTFVGRKYNRTFDFFDDYIMWLYYKKCHENEELYYSMLEKDLWKYSNFQTGDPRKKFCKSETELEMADTRTYYENINVIKKVVWGNGKR